MVGKSQLKEMKRPGHRTWENRHVFVLAGYDSVVGTEETADEKGRVRE